MFNRISTTTINAIDENFGKNEVSEMHPFTEKGSSYKQKPKNTK